MRPIDPQYSERFVHESHRIAHTMCNGCLCVEVLTKRKGGVNYETYYCRHRHGYFDPRDVTECEHVHYEGQQVYKQRPFKDFKL